MVRASLNLLILLLLIPDQGAVALDRYYTPTTINLQDYAPGTFFSFVWSLQTPGHIYIAPGEGAVYANGIKVPVNQTVLRYRGHYTLAIKAGVVEPGVPEHLPVYSDWRGGGLRYDPETGHLNIYHKSRSMNHFLYGDGDLNPALEPIIEAEIRQLFPRYY